MEFLNDISQFILPALTWDIFPYILSVILIWSLVKIILALIY